MSELVMQSPLKKLASIILLGALVELCIFVYVSHWIGFIWALTCFVLSSFLGGALLKRRLRQDLFVEDSTKVKATAMIALDRQVWILAAVLLILPGLLTDALGLLLFVPGFRFLLVRGILTKLIKSYEDAFAQLEQKLRASQVNSHGYARHGHVSVEDFTDSNPSKAHHETYIEGDFEVKSQD